MKSTLKPMLAVALALAAAQAPAATQFGEHFTLSGFGTLGVVQTDTDAAQYVRDVQTDGAREDLEFNVDSNLGVQLNAKANDWLSATVQLLAMHRSEPNIDIKAQWAFVKIQPLEGLSLRAGRMDIPMFAVSDFRNVGYANTWVRPPDEVYALALLQSLEGADLTYRLPIGSTSLTASVLAGKSSLALFGGTLDVENVKGVNVQWEADWLTVRLGRIKGEVSQGQSGDPYTFSGIGVTVDRNNLVMQSEFVTRRSEGFGPTVDSDGWYVLGGYRFGPVLPYVSYSSTAPKEDAAFHLSYEQTTLAAGVRWDAFKSAAVKFQLQHVDTNGTRGISFITPVIPQAGPVGMPAIYEPVTSTVYVASLAIDFVF